MKLTIKPYIGVGEFLLLSSEIAVTDSLKKNKIPYSVEIWDNSECTVKVPWTIIHANNAMDFFFARDKLWKIRCSKGFVGSLTNGITVGMDMREARRRDNTLKYDDWNEDWGSEEGYWLEDSLDDNSVVSISIFIREVLDDDAFDKYEWQN